MAPIAKCCSRPRELDINQLPDASKSWINPHFVYTHGYGVVLAPVSKITPDGLPVLLIENAPPEIKTPSLKLTRPEIYYGEVVQEPVFVHTAQEEFNYPSGEDNVHSRYEGNGGFPMTRLPHAPGRRRQRGRTQHPAHQLPHHQQPHDDPPQDARAAGDPRRLPPWDKDPYLVITDAGRLVWMVDGYTTSDAHPVLARRGRDATSAT